MRINVAVPEAHVSAPVLDAALESVTRLNESMLRKGEIPTFQQGLNHGIKWKPEPPGAEHFDHGLEVLQRKWGDCDDLAPWHAASLRHTGEDTGAQAVAKRSGPQRWHAVVQRSDGTIDDPSKRAGMESHSGILGGVLPLMYAPPSSVSGTYIIRPQIALRPVRGAFQARADLPWYWREHLDDKPTPTDYAMTALHTAPLAATALTGAIDGIVELGACAGFGLEDDLDRLSAIADVCGGVPFREVREIYGDEHAEHAQYIVGSFFSKLAKGISSVVPFVSNVVTKAGSFATKFASNPRGAIMDAVNDIGHVKLLGVPIGAANLIWLADEAARKGLGHDLYKHLEALGPNGIPGGPAAKAAAAFVHKLAPAGSALQTTAALAKQLSQIRNIPGSVPIPPDFSRAFPGVAAFF